MSINWKHVVLAVLVGIAGFGMYLYIGMLRFGRRLETMDFPGLREAGHQVEKQLPFVLEMARQGSAFAQNATRPDLSGTWKLNLAKSQLGKHEKITSETLTIRSTDTTIEFHYTTDGTKSVRTYIADGKERTAVEVKDGQRVATATWNKSVLVIEESDRSKMQGHTPDEAEWFRATDRWTLTSNGNSLTRDSNSPQKHQVFVYDKE